MLSGLHYVHHPVANARLVQRCRTLAYGGPSSSPAACCHASEVDQARRCSLSAGQIRLISGARRQDPPGHWCRCRRYAVLPSLGIADGSFKSYKNLRLTIDPQSSSTARPFLLFSTPLKPTMRVSVSCWKFPYVFLHAKPKLAHQHELTISTATSGRGCRAMHCHGR